MCISGSVPKEPAVQRKPSSSTLDESPKHAEKRTAESAVGAEPESEEKKMRGALGEAFSPSKGDSSDNLGDLVCTCCEPDVASYRMMADIDPFFGCICSFVAIAVDSEGGSAHRLLLVACIASW